MYLPVKVSTIVGTDLWQDMVLEETVIALAINGLRTAPELETKGSILAESTEYHEFGGICGFFFNKVLWCTLSPLRVPPDIL